jgi:hypothetical protein
MALFLHFHPGLITTTADDNNGRAPVRQDKKLVQEWDPSPLGARQWLLDADGGIEAAQK